MTIEAYHDKKEELDATNDTPANGRKTIMNLTDTEADGVLSFKADGKRFGIAFTADFTSTYDEDNDERRLDDSTIKSMTVINCVTDDSKQTPCNYILTDADKKSVAIDIDQNIDLYLHMGGELPMCLGDDEDEDEE